MDKSSWSVRLCQNNVFLGRHRDAVHWSIIENFFKSRVYERYENIAENDPFHEYGFECGRYFSNAHSKSLCGNITYSCCPMSNSTQYVYGQCVYHARHSMWNIKENLFTWCVLFSKWYNYSMLVWIWVDPVLKEISVLVQGDDRHAFITVKRPDRVSLTWDVVSFDLLHSDFSPVSLACLSGFPSSNNMIRFLHA